jgi:hypothetical protein
MLDTKSAAEPQLEVKQLGRAQHEAGAHHTHCCDRVGELGVKRGVSEELHDVFILHACQQQWIVGNG